MASVERPRWRKLILDAVVLLWSLSGRLAGGRRHNRHTVAGIFLSGAIFVVFGALALFEGWSVVAGIMVILGVFHLVGVALYGWPER